MKKIEQVLYFSENTMKYATEKAKKQGIDVTTYLTSKIENEVFREYIEGKFEPIPKYKNKKVVKKHGKQKNRPLQYGQDRFRKC
jgi:hypothetical protein